MGALLNGPWPAQEPPRAVRLPRVRRRLLPALLASAGVALGLWAGWSWLGPEPAPQPPHSNCAEARLAHAAPMTAGDPGYRPALDRDGDGIACE